METPSVVVKIFGSQFGNEQKRSKVWSKRTSMEAMQKDVVIYDLAVKRFGSQFWYAQKKCKGRPNFFWSSWKMMIMMKNCRA